MAAGPVARPLPVFQTSLWRVVTTNRPRLLQPIEARAGVASTPKAALRAAGVEALALLCVLVAAVALRLELLTVRSLWHDEAFSLAVARKPASYILAHLPSVDPHPPGYYLLLRAVLLAFGDQLVVARGLSATLGVAAVLLTWYLARQLFDPAAGLAAAGLVALNPFQVFASNEIRMYPLVTCLALLSTWAAWRAGESRGALPGVVYGVSLAAMAYTSYYTALVAVPQWVWLARARAGRGLLLAIGVAALLYAPWLRNVPLDFSGIAIRDAFRWSHVLEFFSTQAYGGYLFRTTTYLSGGGFDSRQHGMLVVPFGLLALAGAAALWTRNKSATMLVGCTWGGGFGAWVVLSAAIGQLAAYPRHFVFFQPFLAMLVGAGVAHLGAVISGLRRTVAAAGAAVLVLSFLWPALSNLQGNPEYQSFRYDRAAEFVRNLYRPGDALVFYQGGAQRVFREYFNPGGLQIAIDPQFDRWTRAGMRPLLEKAVEPLREVQGRVWLVLAWPYPPDSPVDLINAVESFGYRRVTRQKFNGVEVVVLARAGKR